MTYDFQNGAYISVNGNKLAGVCSAEMLLAREATVTSEGISVPASSNIVITIKRERHFNDTFSDHIKFQSLSNFTVVIYADHCTSSFTGCQWTDYTETMANDNKIVEVVKIVARTYNLTYPQ